MDTSKNFNAERMYDWSEGLIGIIDGYSAHFAEAPADVKRRFESLCEDAQGLRASIREVIVDRRCE